MKKKLLNLILQVNQQGQYKGIMPVTPVIQLALKELKIPVNEIHSYLLELEKDQQIYLETINDVTRLTAEEKKLAHYDAVRGYLFYIGLWN